MRAQLLRRNWYLPAVGAICAVGAQAGLPDSAGDVAGLVVWLGFWFAVFTLSRDAFPLSRPVTVEIENNSLLITGLDPVPTDALIEAKIIPRAGELVTAVLTRRRGKKLSLVMDRDAAAALIQRLGLAAGERRTTFTLESRFHTRFLALALPALAPLAFLQIVAALRNHMSLGDSLLGVLFWSMGLLPLLLAGTWLLGLLKGQLHIGADGVTIQWLFRDRFIAFHDIERIDRKAGLLNSYNVDALLRLKSGKTVLLRSPDAPVTDEDRGAEGRARDEHLDAALRLARLRGGDTSEVLPLVRRGSQPARAWLSVLDAVARDGAGGYRAAAVSLEKLAEILADATQPLDSRVGAAAALLRGGEPAHRQAVRVAADACAEPRLRAALVALDQADSEDDFLAALQQTEEPRRLRR